MKVYKKCQQVKVSTPIERKTLRDKVEINKKALELIAQSNLDKALPTVEARFPRSRHDPYMYEEVVDDILEKDMHRHLIEKDEVAMSSLLKCIGDKQEALMIED